MRKCAIDWKQVIFNMLTIKGIYGREMYETWYKMTVMLESGLDIQPRDHTPVFVAGVREGICRNAFRQLRQSHPRLARILNRFAELLNLAGC